MAFDGNLLYIYNTSTSAYDVFSTKYIYKESYTAQLHVQDLDSTVNANGELERNVLDHLRGSIGFELKPMWNDDFGTVLKFIRDRYTVTAERKLKLKWYCPETNAYREGSFYMADPEPSIIRVDVENQRIMYNSCEINFVEY